MARGIRGILAVLTMLGIVGLTGVTMLSFEELNTSTLFVSGVLVLIGPIAALMHLSLTHGLTADEKRMWFKEFRSAQVWSALSEYLSSPNLSESAKRRAQDALARRESK
jgi:hypothetical protein